jgi:dipeptidyl aminopeptidase/acylaminoacyl peptidase
MRRHCVFSLGLTALALSATAVNAQKRAITYEEFAALKSVSDPQISPDGHLLLYTVRTTDLTANRRLARTLVMELPAGTPRQFPNDSTRATEARWSPDGRQIAFIAGGQLWTANADGSALRRLTTLNGGASGPKWAPSGDRLVFVSAVYPECSDDACNTARAKSKEENKVKARASERLMYRHWDTWDEGTRSHLFIVSPAGSGLRDLTAGARYDVPPPPFGGSEAYTFSPDGRELAYTAKDETQNEAWTTDLNVYTVSVEGGAPSVITRENRGADQNPVYSPDGRWLAYASQSKAGFESDRWRLMFYERAGKRAHEVLPRWDRWAESYFFGTDGRMIYVGAGDRARDKLFAVALDSSGRAAGAPEPLIVDRNNTQFSLSADGQWLVWARDAAHHPAEIWRRQIFVASIGEARTRASSPESQVTHENDTALAQLDLKPIEEFWFRGAAGDSVHGFVVKPPAFTTAQKYPVVLLIHGGPQGAWLDSWSTRWNYQLFAATGAAIVALNPHGSTGYGQAFVNAVTKDWGGKPYQDLMRGLTAALSRNAWMDSTRMGAAGGSYGGYMVNWIAGHTNRFKTLVSHAGVFNLESMYGATEELWFTDWELGGPWWSEEAMKSQYRVYSPHLFARNFKTPTLVIHGELDYRVPYSEGLSLFTSLQRQGVPSRLLVYPDEGHWILKPQNHRLWMNEVQAWLARWLGTAKLTS